MTDSLDDRRALNDDVGFVHDLIVGVDFQLAQEIVHELRCVPILRTEVAELEAEVERLREATS